MDGDGLMSQSDESYPAELEVEYPDRELNWKTTFFRIFLVTPIGIILGLLSGPVVSHQSGDAVFAVGGIVVFPTMLMLLFRQKYPRWWFDWNLELTRFSMRVAAYLALLRDEYPSTDNEQAVHVWVPYPDAKELSRWLPLLKWFLAVPHYIVLCFLGVAAVVAVILAWFAILLTGRYPPGLFNFVVGVLRYGLRINAYAFLLVTDQYPPFRLG